MFPHLTSLKKGLYSYQSILTSQSKTFCYKIINVLISGRFYPFIICVNLNVLGFNKVYDCADELINRAESAVF